MAKPTLRFSSRGPDVVQLQQGLNRMPTAQPKLAEDGIFGARTTARVREFQSANSLTSDGVVGPMTWDTLLKLLGQVASGIPLPPTPLGTQPYDPLRPLVLAVAQKYMGSVDFSVMQNGRPKGLDFLIHMFKFAANTTVTDSNFKGSQGQWVPQPLVGGGRKSWCGIFAVFCYRTAGIPVYWDLFVGGPVGPLEMTQWSPSFAKNIKQADIGVVATQTHHFLIESVGGGPAPRVTSIDGNLTWGQINRVGTHGVGIDNFNYYTLK